MSLFAVIKNIRNIILNILLILRLFNLTSKKHKKIKGDLYNFSGKSFMIKIQYL